MEEQESGNSTLGLVAMLGALMARPFIAIGKAITADGTLEAAYRQGFDEIGEALKAFPESIQVQEPGTILNPTQGEIAADRKPDEPKTPSRPSLRDADNDNRVYDPASQERQQQEHGRDM